MQPPLAVRVQEVSQFRISHIYTLSNKNLLEGLVCVCVHIYLYASIFFAGLGWPPVFFNP